MPESKYSVITAADKPGLIDIAHEITQPEWPEFMMKDPIANEHWHDLYERFPEFQFVLQEKATESLVAVGNSIPLAWSGEIDDLPDDGWDWALLQGVKDHEAGRTPTIFSAIQIVISSKCQGQGLSAEAVRAMKAGGRKQSLETMVAPVRPNLKHVYPLTPMDDYIRWTTEEGLPFDPWMRVHAREGARVVKACPRAMRIGGTIAEWESWTGMRFPESGRYTVKGALVPVDMDIEADRGIYIEPNVWMHHLR